MSRKSPEQPLPGAPGDEFEFKFLEEDSDDPGCCSDADGENPQAESKKDPRSDSNDLEEGADSGTVISTDTSGEDADDEDGAATTESQRESSLAISLRQGCSSPPRDSVETKDRQEKKYNASVWDLQKKGQPPAAPRKSHSTSSLWHLETAANRSTEAGVNLTPSRLYP
ncbi:MAG: hypothetical protein K0U23_07860 [Gammaproteobacteria bacterium]|nr:hypothetical protein [Gammaproteobacteria bacterium]